MTPIMIVTYYECDYDSFSVTKTFKIQASRREGSALALDSAMPCCSLGEESKQEPGVVLASGSPRVFVILIILRR